MKISRANTMAVAENNHEFRDGVDDDEEDEDDNPAYKNFYGSGLNYLINNEDRAAMIMAKENNLDTGIIEDDEDSEEDVEFRKKLQRMSNDALEQLLADIMADKFYLNRVKMIQDFGQAINRIKETMKRTSTIDFISPEEAAKILNDIKKYTYYSNGNSLKKTVKKRKRPTTKGKNLEQAFLHSSVDSHSNVEIPKAKQALRPLSRSSARVGSATGKKKQTMLEECSRAIAKQMIYQNRKNLAKQMQLQILEHSLNCPTLWKPKPLKSHKTPPFLASYRENKTSLLRSGLNSSNNNTNNNNTGYSSPLISPFIASGKAKITKANPTLSRPFSPASSFSYYTYSTDSEKRSTEEKETSSSSANTPTMRKILVKKGTTLPNDPNLSPGARTSQCSSTDKYNHTEYEETIIPSKISTSTSTIEKKSSSSQTDLLKKKHQQQQSTLRLNVHSIVPGQEDFYSLNNSLHSTPTTPPTTANTIVAMDENGNDEALEILEHTLENERAQQQQQQESRRREITQRESVEDEEQEDYNSDDSYLDDLEAQQLLEEIVKFKLCSLAQECAKKKDKKSALFSISSSSMYNNNNNSYSNESCCTTEMHCGSSSSSNTRQVFRRKSKELNNTSSYEFANKVLSEERLLSLSNSNLKSHDSTYHYNNNNDNHETTTNNENIRRTISENEDAQKIPVSFANSTNCVKTGVNCKPCGCNNSGLSSSSSKMAINIGLTCSPEDDYMIPKNLVTEERKLSSHILSSHNVHIDSYLNSKNGNPGIIELPKGLIIEHDDLMGEENEDSVGSTTDLDLEFEANAGGIEHYQEPMKRTTPMPISTMKTRSSNFGIFEFRRTRPIPVPATNIQKSLLHSPCDTTTTTTYSYSFSKPKEKKEDGQSSTNIPLERRLSESPQQTESNEIRESRQQTETISFFETVQQTDNTTTDDDDFYDADCSSGCENGFFTCEDNSPDPEDERVSSGDTEGFSFYSSVCEFVGATADKLVDDLMNKLVSEVAGFIIPQARKD